MKTLLLSILIGVTPFISSARDITITIYSATPDSLIYDVVWGPALPASHEEIVLDAATGFRVVGEEFPSSGKVDVRSVLVPSGSYYFEAFFDVSTSRTFTTPEIAPGSFLPLSITPTADGFGAHFVFSERIYYPVGLQQQIPASEYAALLDFYRSTQGDTWLFKGGWNDPDATSWHGVTVSGFQYDSDKGTVVSLGHVTQLNLTFNNLTGSLPDSLGDLQKLEQLNLYVNQLSGTIPQTIGNLLQLTELTLAINQLSGSIPASIGNLVNLRSLILSDNQLSGAIPDLSKLTQLGSFVVRGNYLTGDIPDFPLFTTLQSLAIDHNCFDISPGSQVWTVVQKYDPGQIHGFSYSPQNVHCSPAPLGDFNGDWCVDRNDLTLLMAAIRARSTDSAYDLNHDGKVDIADARSLTLRFSNPGGAPCSP